jgi:hypothetical protein
VLRWMRLVLGSCVLVSGGASGRAVAAPYAWKEVDGVGRVVRMAGVGILSEQVVIGAKRIWTETVFENGTDTDAVVALAVQLPEYRFVPAWQWAIRPGQVVVRVEGRVVPVSEDARALVLRPDGPVDVTQAVLAAGLSVTGFGGLTDALAVDGHGHWELSGKPSKLDRLPLQEKKRLFASGAIALDDNAAWPKWAVRPVYHWKQAFPPRHKIKVEVEYVPALEPEDPRGEDVSGETCGVSKTRSEGVSTTRLVRYEWNGIESWGVGRADHVSVRIETDGREVGACWMGKGVHGRGPIVLESSHFVPFGRWVLAFSGAEPP